MAVVMGWSGHAEDSLPWLDKALGKSRYNTAVLLQTKCAETTYLGRYEEAVAACEKSAALGSDRMTYAFLTAGYAQLGNDVKAAANKERFIKLWPEFTIDRFRSLSPSDNPVYWQAVETHFFGGLRKAGVPEK